MLYSRPSEAGEPRVRTQDTHEVLKYSHLGIMFALLLGGSLAAGRWADERYEASPTFTVLGLLVGFGVGFYHLYRSVYGVGGVVGPSEDGPGATDGDAAGPPDPGAS